MRRITAVYYPNGEWRDGDGGELVVHPKDPERRRVVRPTRDRLVLFRSDQTEHEVYMRCRLTSG